jgi:membrane-associated protease RseP (regulator of RpoE activity)
MTVTDNFLGAPLTVSRWVLAGLAAAVASGTTIGIAIAFLYVLVLIHEAGHALAGRATGYFHTGISLNLMGGVCRYKDDDGWQDKPLTYVIISSGGIVAQIVFLFATLLASPLLTERMLDGAVEINVLLIAFNAVPVFPLDGGHILRALLNSALGPGDAADCVTGWVSVVTSAALACYLYVYGMELTALFCVFGVLFNYSAIRGKGYNG